jgi:phage tail-like protein
LYKIPKNLTDYFYEKLPVVYREQDNMQLIPNPLKRFLSAIVEGGFTPVLQNVLDINNLIDVEKCPTKYLPLLCQNYGVEYSPDIEESYQRKFLDNFGELNKRKGTKSCLEYLARELAGPNYGVVIEDSGNVVRLYLTTYGDDSKLNTKQTVIEKYVSQYLPSGMVLDVMSSYYYSEIAKFLATKDEVVESLIITHYEEDSSAVSHCTESFRSDIIEAVGNETAYIPNEGKVCLSNVSYNDWFYAGGYGCVDKITHQGIETIIFN